jgi:hypothetical protein
MNRRFIESLVHDIGIHFIDEIKVSESRMIDMLKNAEYYLDFDDIDWTRVYEEFERISRKCAERYMSRTPED